jgi:hypothetical protein
MTNLTLAARYLRILYAIEQAQMTGDEHMLISLLSSVDPIEVKELSSKLEREEKRQRQMTIAEAAA